MPAEPDDAGRIEQLLGRRPEQLRRQGGGDIARSCKATFADGLTAMVKFARPGQPSLRLEARMLSDLRQAGLPVPQTLAVADDVLLLAWVDPGGRDFDDAVQATAGRAIGLLHNQRLAEHFGYPCDTVIGSLPQANPETGSWLDFFRDERLLARADAALEAGQLPAALRHRLDTLGGRLGQWLPAQITPSLIHGDLWGGNMLATAAGGACFIDPAIYFGAAGMDLAMATLFNSVRPAFFDGYREVRPIGPDFFAERCALYQLYPLLVHVQLFGGSYVSAVERVVTQLGC